MPEPSPASSVLRQPSDRVGSLEGERLNLPNTWVAVDAGIDPRSWARLLRRAYDRAVASGAPPTIVRDVVADSWVRSERARVDPVGRAPIMLERGETRRLFQRHRLAPLLQMVEGVLVEVAEYAHQVVAIADREGLVLWTGGNAGTLEAARRILSLIHI